MSFSNTSSELIQDQYAAIIELVKNALDADSQNVVISFNSLEDQNFEIVIEDHGHGMTKDIVVVKWLVPSTDDKFKQKLHRLKAGYLEHTSVIQTLAAIRCVCFSRVSGIAPRSFNLASIISLARITGNSSLALEFNL